MKYTLVLSFCFLCSLSTYGQDASEVRKKHYNHKKGLAIQGYDPVAYFTENKAKKGSKNITYTHNGITYRFSSNKNLNLFKAEPSKYEPTYGGWCAYAMGVDGDKVSIDPETFKIKDGKLYLFYNRFFINTLTKWNKDESNLQSKADKYWKKTVNSE
ncbi:MAG: YHS domain protein [Leptospiraceae bacterium]|nr:YHS domain protein [Leptospiraceae bacterium]MCP5497227.1 YHS domain protein [Leptospiraceae bacterium]